jgi:futalosine hydrolase
MLVCAATLRELKTYSEEAACLDLSDDAFFARSEDGETAYLLTGVGIPLALGRLLPLLPTLRPRLVLNIGIAGAYPESGLSIGDIVLADGEIYGDIGFDLPDSPGFQPLSQTAMNAGFYGQPFPTHRAPEFRAEPNGDYRLHVGRGCTVNACTGTEAMGRLRARLFGAAFETMEGAAVAQAAGQHGIPVCEIRAISNLAARRDMRPENIARALRNLESYLRACP